MAQGCVVKVCACDVSMSNTGTACMPAMQVAKKLITIPVFDYAGVRNGLDLTTPITLATFAAFINDTDDSQRMYPLPEMKNINDTRNDPVTEEFDDGSKFFIREGTRNFESIIVPPFASPILKGKLDAIRCNEMGVYIIDRKGSLIGIISDDGTKLYPIRIDSGSFSAQLLSPTNSTVSKLQIRFSFNPEEDDACLRMITPAEMDGANLLVINGLLDVHATFSSISTTGFTVQMDTEFGTALTKVPVEGLVIADFISSVTLATSKARNVTDSADITLTTVVESTTVPGQYVVVMPAQTSADVLTVTCKKNGYDFTLVADEVVTIP